MRNIDDSTSNTSRLNNEINQYKQRVIQTVSNFITYQRIKGGHLVQSRSATGAHQRIKNSPWLYILPIWYQYWYQLFVFDRFFKRNPMPCSMYLVTQLPTMLVPEIGKWRRIWNNGCWGNVWIHSALLDLLLSPQMACQVCSTYTEIYLVIFLI